MKSWQQQNTKEIYLTHNQGKSVVAEKFIRTFKMKFISLWLQYQKMCILINYMI